MRYTNALLAQSASFSAAGVSAQGAFIGWWGPTTLPALAQLAIVWCCDLTPEELGKPLSFDVYLTAPSGGTQLLQRIEGIPNRTPAMPAAIPYFFEFNFINQAVEFQVEGLHRFLLRSNDGTECSIPLWVQGVT